MKIENVIVQNGNTSGDRQAAFIHQVSQSDLIQTGLKEILFINSYPPRECGIASYSHDLFVALNDKFSSSFSARVCALQVGEKKVDYPPEVKYVLDTTVADNYLILSHRINNDKKIKYVLIQHEFGFFAGNEIAFTKFLYALSKRVFLVFHTVLPGPDEKTKNNVQQMAAAVENIIVMTNTSADVLINDYDIDPSKIKVIPHGTHLMPHVNKQALKDEYSLNSKIVLSTFGLLSSGKNIETTLDALPAIIKSFPNVMFLVIGKTHPVVLKQEGEKYHNFLQQKVKALELGEHVRFINQFLPLEELLEYLQLTDIYLFTSKDRNQAVSGTFSYAISCGCPVISTPIPHAREVLGDDGGIIIPFESPDFLADAVIRLLNDELLRTNISIAGLQKMASTAWENSAIAHVGLIAQTKSEQDELKYDFPPINQAHINRMTTEFGMIQFSKNCRPDLDSGYTLDDNARALIARVMHYEIHPNPKDLEYIKIYLEFIEYCLQPDGSMLNYVDERGEFADQNWSSNLADANGRAIWALGYFVSMRDILPDDLVERAITIIQKQFAKVLKMHSTRSMAFIIKGLYFYNQSIHSALVTDIITTLANRLVQMYRHESEVRWLWFESYLTYGNSVLPEAMLCAWQETGVALYKDIAEASFDFLISKTFNDNQICVISHKSWLHKGMEADIHGEQPIDVAYTILALQRFNSVFKNKTYQPKLIGAFNWFLGKNKIQQIVYNPMTGGCYDGMENNQVNLNQGAESSLSYLISRMTIEKFILTKRMLLQA